jgi:hypothetical protein
MEKLYRMRDRGKHLITLLIATSRALGKHLITLQIAASRALGKFSRYTPAPTLSLSHTHFD